MSNGLKQLSTVHLTRLSPMMWSLPGGYPRKGMSTPIGPAMGSDDGRYVSVPLISQAQPVWNNLYRTGVIGGMSRVAPFGPAAFGSNGEAATESFTFGHAVALLLIAVPMILVIFGSAGSTWGTGDNPARPD